VIGNIGGRRRAGGAVSVFEHKAGANTDTVTFDSGTPANGRLICIIALATGNPATITGPAGFTAGPALNQGGSRPMAMFWKVASSEASATYTVTTSSGNVRCMGFLIDGAHATVPVGNSGSNSDATTGTSLACASSPFNVSAGSVVIVGCGAGNSVAGMSYTNSYATALLSATGNQLSSTYRAYASADTSQSTTGSWTINSTNRKGLMVEILKA
jgi:hypothetical protein